MQNKVLTDNFQQSQNFYQSDLWLQHQIEKNLDENALDSIQDRLAYIGKKAALEMDTLSMLADKNPPKLVKRDPWGEDINQIEFHPSYPELVDIAAKSGMFQIKWKPENRSKYPGQTNQMSFAISSIYAMSEMGVYCPLCMTDGAAVLIDKFCSEEDKNRLLPAICADNEKDLKTGAMYLTEKAGGSDVGANLVTATHVEDDWYHLNGEKWFCSNANGEIAFVLARTNEEVSGTQGLSIFLVEKIKPDGSKNPMEIVRLKDKLGVQSMASAEIILTNTLGKRIGEEYKGFKIMTQMINLSRLYNSVAAISASRRATIEAFQFLNARNTFGKNALEHPLIRTKLLELSAEQMANFYLTWRAIKAIDAAEQDENEAQLLRVLTPMTKKWTAEKGVYITRESMELMGGIGYIQDQVMPKIMRDIMVLPIWEGAGNIMTLDMLRASTKTKGLEFMLKEIALATKDEKYGQTIGMELQELHGYLGQILKADEDTVQVNAKPFFESLTQLYQMTLLIQNKDETSEKWIAPALSYFDRKIKGQKGYHLQSSPSIETIRDMMGWST